MNIKTGFTTIKQFGQKIKRQILFALLAIVVIAIGYFLGRILIKPSLARAVFVCHNEGQVAKLFYTQGGHLKELVDLPAEKTIQGDYKIPNHLFISKDGKNLIFFKKTSEKPLGTLSDNKNLTAYRIMYEPQLVNLKNGASQSIKQEIDSNSLLFSPDGQKIAWVLKAEESTIQELEKSGRQRELWLSNPDGQKAVKIASFEEKVIILQRWVGDHIYFLAIRGLGYYDLGMVNVKTGRLNYFYPRYCLEDLSNCQNFTFSSSGNYFIYEAGTVENNVKTIGLFVESLDKNKSWKVLVNNYVSDRLWLPDEKSIVYTEQLNTLKNGVQEKVHQVTLSSGKDEEMYVGGYLSQLTIDQTGRYLYFIEKENDHKFNLVRLDLKYKTTKILQSGDSSNLKVFSNN